MKEIRVEASYNVDLKAGFGRVFYGDPDKEIEHIVGRESDASGAGFGYRDLAWYFKRSNVAWDKARKLLTHPAVVRVTVAYVE